MCLTSDADVYNITSGSINSCYHVFDNCAADVYNITSGSINSCDHVFGNCAAYV